MTPIGPASAAQDPRIPVDTSVPKSRLQDIDQQITKLTRQERCLGTELAAISASATAPCTTPHLRNKVLDMLSRKREEIKNLKKEKENLELYLLFSSSIPAPLGSSSRTEEHSAQLSRREESSKKVPERIDVLHTFLPHELLGQIIHKCSPKTLQNLLLCSKAEKNSILANMGPKAALLFVTANPDNYRTLSPNNPSKNDPNIVHEILRRKPELFFELSEPLQDDPALRMTSYLCAHLVGNTSLRQRLIQFDEEHQPSCLFPFAAQVHELKTKNDLYKAFFERHPVLRNNPAAMFAFIISTKDENLLRFASVTLKKNPTFVLAVVTNYGQALYHADPELRKDPTIVLAAVTNNGRALRFINLELRKDPTIVLAAVTNYGDILQLADQRLQNDPKFVLAAVTNFGRALEWADQKLQNDPKIVLAAVTNYGGALEWADLELRKDPTIVLAAVTNKGCALRFVAPPLRKDPKIVLAAVTNNGRALEFANRELQNDPKIVLAAVTNDGWALGFASRELQRDPKIVLAAVTQSGAALAYASQELRKDPTFMLAAVTSNGLALGFAEPELQITKLTRQERCLGTELAAISASATAPCTTPPLRNKVLEMLNRKREEIKNLKKEKEDLEPSLLFSSSIPAPLGSSSKTEEHSTERRRREEPSEKVPERIDLLHTFLPHELLGQIIHKCSPKTLQNLLFCSKAERNSILANMGPKAALLFVTANPDNYRTLSSNNPSKTDPNIVHEILRRKPELFFELSEALQDDPALRMTSYLCAHLAGNTSLCQRLIQFDKDHQPNCLSTFATQVHELKTKYDLNEAFFGRHPELRNNHAAMFAFFISTKNGGLLQFSSDTLKKNHAFVLATVTKSGMALQYAASELQKDPRIVLAAVTNFGMAFQFADPELRKNPRIVLAAVTNLGGALKFANPELQKDSKIVLAAVTEYGFALQHASPELQDNPEIVQAAIQQSPGALQYASPRLQAIFGRLEVQGNCMKNFCTILEIH